MATQTETDNRNGMASIELPHVLTAEEVGDILRVPAATVRNLHRYGRLRGERVGRQLRWSRGRVLSYIRSLEGTD